MERSNLDTSALPNSSTFRRSRLPFRKKDKARDAARGPNHVARATVPDSRSPHEAEHSSSRPVSLKTVASPVSHRVVEDASCQLQQQIIKLRSKPKQNVDDAYKTYERQAVESSELCRLLLQSERRKTSIDSRNTIAIFKTTSSQSDSSDVDFGSQIVLVQDYISYQETLLENIRSALSKTYQNYEPNATNSQIELLFRDRAFRDSAVDHMRSASMNRILSDPPLLWAQCQIRFRNYERVQKDIADIKRLFQLPSASSSDITIAENGDIVLEFNRNCPAHPVFRFRVISQLLREVSPLFAQMLADAEPSRSTFNFLGNSTPDSYFPYKDSDLPPLPTIGTLRDGSSVKVYHMPQTELNKHNSLTILLQAAHLHRTKVPRDITFDEFVSIAEVCLKYRCTSPLEDRVENRWLPRWVGRAADERPDGFLLVCYVFGERQLFSRASKSAILNIKDEDEICPLWPIEVNDKIKTIRKAKLEQVRNCCMTALSEYLGKPSPERIRHSLVGPLQFSTGPKCPKGDFSCDAQNMGWLMLVLNEVGILPSIMRFEDPPELPKGSLEDLMDRLRSFGSVPVKEGHGDMCNYAPAFRSALDDIYNSITGLTLKDVSGQEGWSLSRFSNIPSADEPMSHEIDDFSLANFPSNNEESLTSIHNHQTLQEGMTTTPNPNHNFDSSGSDSQPGTPPSEDVEEAPGKGLSPDIESEAETDYILHPGRDAPLQPLASHPIKPRHEIPTISRFSSTASSSSEDGENAKEQYSPQSRDKTRKSIENKFLREEFELRKRGIGDQV